MHMQHKALTTITYSCEAQDSDSNTLPPQTQSALLGKESTIDHLMPTRLTKFLGDVCRAGQQRQ